MVDLQNIQWGFVIVVDLIDPYARHRLQGRLHGAPRLASLSSVVLWVGTPVSLSYSQTTSSSILSPLHVMCACSSQILMPSFSSSVSTATLFVLAPRSCRDQSPTKHLAGKILVHFRRHCSSELGSILVDRRLCSLNFWTWNEIKDTGNNFRYFSGCLHVLLLIVC